MSKTRHILNELANHLEGASQAVRALADSHATSDSETAKSRDAGAADLSPDEWVDLGEELHPLIGPRQKELLWQVANAHPESIGSGPIARAMNYDHANAGLGLDALTKQGLVRKDTSSRPYKYFLGDRLVERAERHSN